MRPEAVVWINGQKYNVGGLIWQPLHNYLDMRWLDKMAVDRSAFQFKGYTTGTTVERFPWKKRREWMPSDMPWPAPGKSLTLTFTAPKDVATSAYSGWFRDFVVGYKETKPRTMDPKWKAFLSGKYEHTSLQNEGKLGEIMAYENTFAFAEIPWAHEGYTVGVQVSVDPGTDRSTDWGPGIALVYPGNKVVKLYLRTGEGKFGMSLNGKENGAGKMQDGKMYQLRLLVQPGRRDRRSGRGAHNGRRTWCGRGVGALRRPGQTGRGAGRQDGRLRGGNRRGGGHRQPGTVHAEGFLDVE